MPLEENTYDEISSGRVDTLVQAVDRIERLEKQLEVAKDALIYAKEFYQYLQMESYPITKALKELENE